MGTCVSSYGYLGGEGVRFLATRTAATIKKTVAVAQFSLNAYDAVKNYKKLADVSSRGLTLEEQQFSHVRDVYWAQEDKFLNEHTQPIPWEDQAVLAKRYAGRMWAPVANSFAKRFKELECNKIRYCGTAYKRTLQEILVARGTARANIESLADRIAFYEIQQIRETDFERRKAAIALRKGLVAQAAALMASAANGLAEAGASAMSQANEALRAVGYFNEQGKSANEQFTRSMTRNANEAPAPVEDRSTRSPELQARLDTIATEQGFSYASEFGDPNSSVNPSSIDYGSGTYEGMSLPDWNTTDFSAGRIGDAAGGTGGAGGIGDSALF